MATTTVKVSKETLVELEKLRDHLNVSSLDEAIVVLIRKHRAAVLDAVVGADKGKVKPFTESDRGEDR